ncbi:MAG: precorrin-8X methylmutase [Desulfovibrionaceae bacterium]
MSDSRSDPVRLSPHAAPAAIEAESFRIIESEVPEPRPFAGAEWRVVRRMIHTGADFELLDLVRFSPGAVAAGVAALSRGCRIVTDTEMARAGMVARRMEPLSCRVECLMHDPRAAERARRDGGTRARAAVDLCLESGGADVWAIGNAPTALIRLLERLDAGAPRPALVVGLPVGFVNAAESKALLLARPDLEFITVRGRKGGSTLVAAVVNALAEEALAI